MKFTTIIRLAAIALGILSATIMAQRGFEISFNEDFLAFLDQAGNLISGILDPLERVLIKLLTWLDVEIELQDHWKYAFILLWLLIGTIARVYQSQQRMIQTVSDWIWGGVCALSAGVLAGMAPLSDPAVFWWPAGSVGLYFTGSFVIYATFSRPGGQTWIGAIGSGGLLGIVWFGLLSAAGIASLRLPFFKTALSPGLALLALLIGFFGVIWLVAGTLICDGDGETWWQKFLDTPRVRVGIDILSVLGGAAFLTTVAHALA